MRLELKGKTDFIEVDFNWRDGSVAFNAPGGIADFRRKGERIR